LSAFVERVIDEATQAGWFQSWLCSFSWTVAE
jgi:hypothetical protein